MADNKKGVHIPVEVTGADKAQADLKQTRAAVEQVGGAGASAAPGLKSMGDAAGSAAGKSDEAGKGAKKAAAGMFEFDNKAEQAAKTLLGALNPQLAGAADGILDLLGGLGRINPAMVAVAVGAVALGGISKWFADAKRAAEEFAKELERIAELDRKLRAEGQSRRAAVADELAKVGVFDAEAVTRAASESVKFGRQGVRAGLAQDAAVAAEVARAGGAAFDPFQFIAGLLAQGKTSADFGKSNADALNAIQTALARGASPDAQQAGRQYLDATFAAAIAESAGAEPDSAKEDARAAVDAVVKAIAEKRGLKPEQVESVRRVVEAELGVTDRDPTEVRKQEGLDFRFRLRPRPSSPFGNQEYDYVEDYSDKPGTLESVAAAGEAETRLRPAFERRDMTGRATDTTTRAPVVIQNITNIGTVYTATDRLGDLTFNPQLDQERFRR